MKARGRKAGWLPVVASAATVLSLAGCIPVPVPTSRPYDRSTLDDLAVGKATQQTVLGLLGEPRLIREGGRYWAYAWTEDGGRLIVLPPLLLGGPMDAGPLVRSFNVLFLEFDSGGLLIGREPGRKVRDDGGDDDRYEYCTQTGLCLEHSDRYLIWGMQRPGSGVKSGSFGEVLTVSGARREQLPMPEPTNEHCAVVIWPAPKDWSSASGVAISIREPTPGFNAWLPPGTFAAFGTPVGERSVTIHAPREPWEAAADAGGQLISFDCFRGSTTYLEIGLELHGQGARPSPVVRPVDPSQGVAAVADMRRVLLP